MGNHDRVAAGLEEPDDFNALAREAILWTRGVLTQATPQVSLRNSPIGGPLIVRPILVHGSPRDPDEYILTTAIARENMAFMRDRLGSDLCFFGHTHVSGIFDGIYDNTPTVERTFSLKRDSACLVNPGSIGQPRDRDPAGIFSNL